MSDFLNTLNEILIAFSQPDNEIRAKAEEAFFNFLENDPNMVINSLFMIIENTQNTIIRMHGLINCQHFLFKERTRSSRLLTLETYQSITKYITQFLQSKGFSEIELNYIFMIVDCLIPIIIIPGHWPQIFEIMWNLLSTSRCHSAITFFSHYISMFNLETVGSISPDVLERLPQLIMLDSPDPKVRIASISLTFNLMQFKSQLFDLLNVIPQVIGNLPDNDIDIAISQCVSVFQSNYSILGPYLDGFISAFIQIAMNDQHNESARISSIEAIEKMISRSPQVIRFLNENSGPLLQMFVNCFSNAQEFEGTYNSSILLFEKYIDNSPEAKKEFLANIAPNEQALSPLALSTFYKYLPAVQNINKVIQLAGFSDRIVSQNAFDTIDELLHNNYQKLVTKNPGIIQTLLNVLFEFINNNHFEAIEPLARLAESLVDYNKSVLQQIAPNLLSIINKVVNPASIRCIAAIASAFPNEISSNAINYATIAMKVVIDGTDPDSCYALMIAISTFAKCMPQNHLEEFVVNLMQYVNQNLEASMFLGIRIIAQQIGQHFSQFLPNIIPYLISTANQEIEKIVETSKIDNIQSTNDNEYSVTYLPGNTQMAFRNEQFAEISSALDSLADYAIAVGPQYEPFYKQTLETAQYAINIVFDEQIRISAINLLSQLSKCNPNDSISIFTVILQSILNNAEPSVNVQKEMVCALERIIKSDNSPNDVRLSYLHHLPTMLELTLKNIRECIKDDEFEGVEDDNYLNLLWSFALALKFLYPILPNETGASFIELSKKLNSFQDEPVLLINQFSMAIWSDFLIDGPENYFVQCNSMLPQILLMIDSPDKDLRRMALFATGRVFNRVNMSAQDIDNILNKLYSAVNTKQAQEDESLYEGNDNALSSYAILLKKRISMGNSSQYISQYISMFPAEDDLDEAKIAYEFLFDLFWEASTNQEITQFAQQIFECLLEGLQIEVVNQLIKKIIETKLQSNSNVPQHVQQLISFIQ